MSRSASPCRPEPAFMMCSMWGCSRSSRGRRRTLLRPCRLCIMAPSPLSQNVLSVSVWLAGYTRFLSSGRASRQRPRPGKMSSRSAPSTRKSSSRTSYSSTGGEMSWSGARIPGTAGPVTCTATRSAQFARQARTGTRWARSPLVAEREIRNSFLLLVPKLKEHVAPVG